MIYADFAPQEASQEAPLITIDKPIDPSIHHEIIPSHDIAQWLLKAIHEVLTPIGLGNSAIIEQIVYVAVVAAAAVLLGIGIRQLVLLIVREIAKVRKSAFLTRLMEHHVITHLTRVITPLLLMALIPFAFDRSTSWLGVFYKVVGIYTLIMFGTGINSIIEFIWSSYNQRVNKDNHPLKGVMNVAKGIVWIIIVIIAGSILMHRSPIVLLGGLGAFAAALMLIFKDSILGLVAGIQLSSNDMLRVGDWIVVPSTIANGIVIDVSLTVVKVQNWDNTIVMLPPYTLVSTSFQNWRGMSESKVRQIDRQVTIDNTSIATIDAAGVDALAAKFPLLADFVANMRKAQADGKEYVFNGGTAPVNGTLATNLGLYRAYLCSYLLSHPAISNTNNVIVRLMTPDANGTPLDIYCFTNTTDWLAYEAIRSQLFEHIAATAPAFGLRIYNATDAGNLTISNHTPS